MTPKQALTRIAEIFSTGDVSDVDLIFSRDYIDHQRPEGWDVNGPEEFRQIVEMARKYLPNLAVKVLDSIEENNTVAGRLYWHSAGNDKLIERETLEILRCQDGKVVEHWGAEAWEKK